MKYLRLILLISILGFGSYLLLQAPLIQQGLLLIISVLTILWLLSLYLKDASIVDSFWGMGFAILAWFYYVGLNPSPNPKNLILCVLVSIWAIRLSVYIGLRNHGKGEDYRYQAMRAEAGTAFWWVSYLRVFILQGVLLWIIASPLFFAQNVNQSFQVFDYVGIILWCIGFGFEAIGDFQLSQFKKNPNNKGQVMNQGLWHYTRHPNYFGDALLWWGYYCFAVSAGAWQTIFAPILMTFLLMKVSGVALLEQSLKQSKPQYQDYIRKTSAFFPWLPKQ